MRTSPHTNNAVRISIQSSKTIELLRFPLAVMVVFIHSFGNLKEIDITDLQTIPITGDDIYNYLRICMSLVLPNIAVPTFFIISGYLFFVNLSQWNWRNYITKMRKRSATIVLPYFIWNIIALLCSLTIFIIGNIIHHRGFAILEFFEKYRWWNIFYDSHIMHNTYPNWLMQQIGMTAPINTPLWFLRDLFVVMLLAPLLYLLIKQTKGYILIFFVFCFISDIWFNVSGLSIMSVLFFSVGATMAIYRKDIILTVQRARMLSYIISPLLIIIMVYMGARNTILGNWINPFYILAGVVALFNIAADISSKGFVIDKRLTSCTMFIFVAHNFLILPYCKKFIKNVLPDNTICDMIGYISSPILCISICVILYQVMKKYIPNITAVIVGQR